MLSNALFPLLSAFAFATQISAGQNHRRDDNTCANIHIISARASQEAPGVGDIGNTLGKNITRDNPGTTMEALNYPATLANYADSSANGTAEMKERLASYTAACPNAKLVLLGYSQGAHVIGDALCGGGDPMEFIGAFTAPVQTNAGNQVVAIIQMGDPRFVPGLSYDVGTSNRNGLFPRSLTASNESCDEYADRIQSYCDENDPFCATGVDASVHTSYLAKYGGDALKFVDQKLQQASSTTGPSSTGSSPSATATHKGAAGVSKELPSALMLAIPIGLALASIW